MGQEAFSPELSCQCGRAQKLSPNIPDGLSDLGQRMGSAPPPQRRRHTPCETPGSLPVPLGWPLPDNLTTCQRLPLP